MPENDLSKLKRKQIRYWCFRFKTEALGGDKATSAPDGLREYFENDMWFQDWKSFGITWDVLPDDPLKLCPLKKSLETAWNEAALSGARDLPVKR